MLGTSKTKNLILVLSLGLSSALSTLALAQSTSAPASGPPPSKIGIVNIQEAIMASNEGQKESNALQQKFGGKQTELKNLNDEVENLKKQYTAQEAKLSDDEKGNRAKVIEAKSKTLQRNYEDFQTEVQQAEQEVINRIGQKMMKTLDKFATAKGYAVVIDVSSPQSPVLFAHEGTMITKDLVDAYNVESGVPAPPAKSSGATPPTRPAAPAATPKKP